MPEMRRRYKGKQEKLFLFKLEGTRIMQIYDMEKAEKSAVFKNKHNSVKREIMAKRKTGKKEKTVFTQKKFYI